MSRSTAVFETKEGKVEDSASYHSEAYGILVETAPSKQSMSM
jgi:hypothetical protein